MTNTIKQAVIKYLEGKDWVYGGTICRELSYDLGHKEAVIERHGLRNELTKGDNPVILKRFVDNPSGHGNKVLQYKINEERELVNSSLEERMRQTHNSRHLEKKPAMSALWEGSGAGASRCSSQ